MISYKTDPKLLGDIVSHYANLMTAINGAGYEVVSVVELTKHFITLRIEGTDTLLYTILLVWY